jgi:hypothetical protein
MILRPILKAVGLPSKNRNFAKKYPNGVPLDFLYSGYPGTLSI